MTSTHEVPELWRGSFILTRDIPGCGLCGVQRFIFSCGLLVDMRFDGWAYEYKARYCYPITADALHDLLTWDGVGDPPGEWITEKVSERVRKESAE